jgi:hypothetical protein
MKFISNELSEAVNRLIDVMETAQGELDTIVDRNDNETLSTLEAMSDISYIVSDLQKALESVVECL